MTKLILKDISHMFGTNQVLSQVNLEVQEGEFVTILGPSGSGKSTIFNIIGGLLVPDIGEVILEGRSVVGRTGHVAYMPQTPSLMPWRTVADNIALGSEIKGDTAGRLDELLERSGFDEIREHYPDSLSGGMKQRVSFLRALNTPGELMLLDEPFSALDEITRYDMQAWLKEILAVEKRTVLMITHSIEEAIKLSDRIVVLEGKPASIHHVIDVRHMREQEIVSLKTQLLEMLR
ncbi:ABC transporter ATP-binding protein [Macrococcus brunensis]|uniref:ABC transporter ATP-binding protein n=1 Tax=Macrococcus brunensis TaxID=198483 RepID=UPI001EF0DFCC|nr:ABC transporter ATP-binding protein [Macrococcus brunensis]ULG72952.1 ABC transporter ATP-binding protein [Macrococcus brunensis]